MTYLYCLGPTKLHGLRKTSNLPLLFHVFSFRINKMNRHCYRCWLGAPTEQRREPPGPRAHLLGREGAQDGTSEGGRDRTGVLQEDAHKPAHGIDTARHSVQHRSYEQARKKRITSTADSS